MVGETLPSDLFQERNMEGKKLKWYIVDKDYVNYLRKYDNKVENIDYADKL